MVHGEVGSRRPDVHTWRHRPHGGSTPVGANACGSLAVLQQAALRFALHHRIPLRISLLLIFGFPFFLSRRGTPPFYISLWDTARRPPRTVKSPQLSLRRVGAKCILSFFGFPKGNPMVHGELASRRPGCILGGVAPQQRESLAVLLARLRSDSPCTIGPPFYISLWDSARSPPPTVKSPLLSLRRVGAKCTLSIFPVSGSGNLRDWGLFSPSSALLCIRRDTETLATLWFSS